MRVLLMASVAIVLFVPTVAFSQVTCQVIMPIPCPPVTVVNCNESMSCVAVPEFEDPQCTAKAVQNTGEAYYGVYPASLGQPGFLFANHVGSVWCQKEKSCEHDCVKKGTLIFFWQCSADASASWVNVGTEYVKLEGASPCVGS